MHHDDACCFRMPGEGTISVKVDVPSQVKGKSTLELSYYIYPVTLRLPGFVSDARFNRRYTDFEVLRNQLAALYWYCIIPPIPEKESVQDKLTKIPQMVISTTNKEGISTNSEQEMLEYRKISLRRFLQRLAYHPILGSSDLLAKFTNDNEWRQSVREPVKPPRFMNTSVLEELAKTLTSGPTGGGGSGAGSGGSGGSTTNGAAYQAALTMEAVDAATWKATGAYIVELETNLRTLRSRMELLVAQHRKAAVAVSNFAESFGLLAEGEEDEGLRSAIDSVRNTGKAVAQVYVSQSEKESMRLVSTLSYYVGMCASVRETLNHMQCCTQYLGHLDKRANELQAVVDRAQGNNVAQAQRDVNIILEQRRQLQGDLTNAEKTFKEEFVEFHRNKQYDSREMLKVFGELQLGFAEEMRKEWEVLRPSIVALAQ